MQEILVVAAIALAVIFIPRLMGRGSASKSEPQSSIQYRSRYQPQKRFWLFTLTGWMRLVIVITFLWVAGCAAYLKPWVSNSFFFFCISLGPAVALWGLIWAWAGYKKYRR